MPLALLLFYHALDRVGQFLHRGRKSGQLLHVLFQDLDPAVLAVVLFLNPFGKLLMLCPADCCIHWFFSYGYVYGLQKDRFRDVTKRSGLCVTFAFFCFRLNALNTNFSLKHNRSK